MNNLEITFQIIGGLAIFLYGVHLSGINLQKILGFRLENILSKTNNNPLKGLTIGAGITTIIQSSGTTITMLVGFIGVGLITFSEATAVMLGANIGSTITTQLASLQVGLYALPVLTLGVIIHIFSIRKTNRNIGEAIIGFGFLFLGMYFIFNGMQSISSNQIIIALVNQFSSNKIVYILILALLTLLLQSSSATSVLVVMLGTTQIISLDIALYMILGVSLGSSLKVVYLAVKKRGFLNNIAVTHLSLNVFGIILAMIFFKYFSYIVGLTSTNLGRQIANGYTLYNIITAIILLPFIPFIIKVTEKYIPKSNIKEKKLSYLSIKLLYTPSIALGQSNRAIVEMANNVSEMLEVSRLMFFEDRINLLGEIKKYEEEIDIITGKVSEYLTQISQQNLSKKDLMKLYSLMHITTDLEHISDYIMIVSELFIDIKTDKIKFSQKAIREISAIFGKLKIMQSLVIKSLEENNLKLAYEIIKHENKVDEIVKKSHSNHLERVSKGICSLENGKYFSDILTNLERIGDHSDNIAYAVVDRFKYK